MSPFVFELEGIASMIATLVRDDPARVVALYETFIAVCDMKAEEIDDSCGMFGQFVGELACGWIEARQENRSDPVETAVRLLDWMDRDDYGFFHQFGERGCESIRLNDTDRVHYAGAFTLVSELDRVAWHKRAIQAVMSATLPSAMEILVKTGESGRLAMIVTHSSDHALEALSHYLTAAAAEILESQDLFLAGRLWQTQGFRIVEAGKARYLHKL